MICLSKRFWDTGKRQMVAILNHIEQVYSGGSEQMERNNKPFLDLATYALISQEARHEKKHLINFKFLKTLQLLGK